MKKDLTILTHSMLIREHRKQELYIKMDFFLQKVNRDVIFGLQLKKAN